MKMWHCCYVEHLNQDYAVLDDSERHRSNKFFNGTGLVLFVVASVRPTHCRLLSFIICKTKLKPCNPNNISGYIINFPFVFF